MRQEDDHLRAPDAAREQPEVEVPPGDPRDGRERRPVEVKLQHGRLAAWRPGPHPMGALAQSALVDEDDRLPPACGVFFSTGHRSRFHRRMAASFRSSARPAGRCGVQPKARNTRQAWTVEYVTWHSRSIRSATRHDVHRLVRYPSASGPRLSPCSMRRRSAADSCGGRPVRGARFNAARPPAASWRAHRFTDWRWTPTRRATSASLTPCSSRRAACRRRRSNCTRSIVTPAGCPMPGRIQQVRAGCHYVL